MLKRENLIILLTIITLFSCGQYNRVLNRGSAAEKYELATQLYERQKFKKALRLFEMISVAYKGKPQMERIQYMISQSYFNTEDYFSSAYYFERFSTNFPKSSKREEAEFLAAKSHFLLSPKYSLDQEETKKALYSFQKYINSYPDSKRLPEANKMVKTLEYKLETKAFRIAKQYHDIGYYGASIAAFDNLTSEFLGTSYREDAFFYKLKASYELATNSVINKKITRLKSAAKVYEKLKRNYPNSKYIEEADKIFINIKQEQNTINHLTQN